MRPAAMRAAGCPGRRPQDLAPTCCGRDCRRGSKGATPTPSGSCAGRRKRAAPSLPACSARCTTKASARRRTRTSPCRTIRRAAALGDDEALLQLGRAYALGMGVPEDLRQAPRLVHQGVSPVDHARARRTSVSRPCGSSSNWTSSWPLPSGCLKTNACDETPGSPLAGAGDTVRRRQAGRGCRSPVRPPTSTSTGPA